MPRDYGLAALSGILGGIGEGGFKGYVSGMDDAHKAAALAEQVRHATTTEGLTGRQLDQQQEAMFVDVPGAGRVRKELAPYMLEKATQGADREREAGRSKAFGDVLLGLDNPEMQTLGQVLRQGGMSSDKAADIYGAHAKPQKPEAMQSWQFQDQVIQRALDEEAAEKRGENPGTRARDYVNLTRPPSVVPNIGLVPRTEQGKGPDASVPPGQPSGNVLPTPGAASTSPARRGPEPFVKADSPLSGEVTQRVASAGNLNVALQAVEEALNNPEVSDYLGPAAQYRSTLQRYTPLAALGAVPADVTKFEGNLATLKNYTIKLITGAQMGEQEATRIMKELPTQLMQPQEFRNRLEMTKRNIDIANRALFNMALTGNQQQKAAAAGVAKDLGLGTPGAVPASSAAPTVTAPAASQPQRTWPEGKRLYSPSQRRWGAMRNGVWIPE